MDNDEYWFPEIIRLAGTKILDIRKMRLFKRKPENRKSIVEIDKQYLTRKFGQM